MNQEEIKAIILGRAYDSYFHVRDAINLNTLVAELGVDETLFWNTVHQMSERGLIEARAAGGNYGIRSQGILKAEEQNLVADGIKSENQHLRTRILDKLATVYETSGELADVFIDSMSQEFSIDIYILVNNLQLLEDLGYIESVASGSFKITLGGLDTVNEWREIRRFATEYEEISNLSPQARGRALQKLLAKVIEKHGWTQEEGARTSNEEMDVVIHKLREYFLIESKWEKDPIEAPVIRELHGKLSNRIGVQGITVSMSGFTGGAVEQAEAYASSRLILFFGKEDIEQILYQRVSFDELLNKKYQQLVTRRKIVYQ
jgi:hypothetical protein